MTDPAILPPLGVTMRQIGQYVEWADLVKLRKHVEAIHSAFNRQYDIRALALVVLILIEDGDSVGYILGMKPKRFYQKARQVLDARYLEIVRMDGQSGNA